MSIFGNSYPKIALANDLNTYIELPHSIVEPNFAEDTYIEQYTLDGNREFIFYSNGQHSSIKIEVHLFKYDNPNQTFANIYAFNHQDVKLWISKDGSPLSGIFTVVKVDHYWKAKPDLFDTAVIYLKSKQPMGIP